MEYISYDQVVPCPNCGLVEEERYDLIPVAARSALYNLEKYGSYIPWAWGQFTFGDQVLSFLFQLLEHDRKHPEERPFSDMAREFLHESVDWGEQPYLRDYIYDIAVRVHEVIQQVE